MNSMVCGKGSDVTCHAGVAASEFLKLGNVIGVGQEADIEYQVAVGRHAVTVAEAGHVGHDLRFTRAGQRTSRE